MPLLVRACMNDVDFCACAVRESSGTGLLHAARELHIELRV